MIDYDVLFMILITIAIVGIMMVLSFLLLELKKNQFSRYEEQLKMANIDKTREYYEELIYKIQSELMENERRWNHSKGNSLPDRETISS